MPFSPVIVMPLTVQVKSCFCLLLLSAAEIVDAAATTWEFFRLAGSSAADVWTCENTHSTKKTFFVRSLEKTFCVS
jgi:hypothetical protein